MQTREQWGARPPTRPWVGRQLKQIERRFVHWTATVPPADHRLCDDTVRQIQRFHQDQRGWSDIAYHWLVCPHGEQYQGRPIDVIGAHAYNHNTGSIGYCAITNREPTTDHKNGLAIVMRADHQRIGKRRLTIEPHSNVRRTECPGPSLDQWCQDMMACTHGYPW